MIRIEALSVRPSGYVPSRLHTPGRMWRETNCYTDLFIEVLHALGCEVEAGLGFTVATGFEVDQWNFFKPPHSDLDALFGVEIQELSLWRDSLEHFEAHLAAGRLVLPEVDAFFLPDVAGSDYRSRHVKSTIAVAALDRSERRLDYFHNAGYFTLTGDDFEGLFESLAGGRGATLPPYTELAKLDRLRRRPVRDLVDDCVPILRSHVNRAPSQNPLVPFGESLVAEVQVMGPDSADRCHAYVFATVRQCGAAFELAAEHLGWLGEHGFDGLEPAKAAFLALAQAAQVLVLKCARTIRGGRPTDLEIDVRSMADDWERGMTALRQRLAT